MARRDFINQNTTTLPNNLANKQVKYTIFMRSLYGLLIRMYKAIQNVRRSPATALLTSSLQQSVVFVPSTWLNDSASAFYLKLKVADHHITAYLDKQPRIVYGFCSLLQKHAFRSTNGTGTSGISWLQLFLLSLAHVPKFLDVISPKSVVVRWSLYKHVLSFRHNALKMFRFAVTPAYAALFKASNEDSRLTVLGISNGWTHVCCHPVLAPEVISFLDQAIFNMCKPLIGQRMQEYLNGQLSMPVKVFKNRCRTNGIVILRRLRVRILKNHGHVVNHSRVYFPIRGITFQCQRGHSRSTGYPFDQFRDKPIHCNVCHRAYASARWQCPCQIAWHSCPVHFCSFSAKVPNTAKKRKLTAATAEQSAKRLAAIEPSSNCTLGPILANRFPHLARNCHNK